MSIREESTKMFVLNDMSLGEIAACELASAARVYMTW